MSCEKCGKGFGFLSLDRHVCDLQAGCGKNYCKNCLGYSCTSAEQPNKPMALCEACFRRHCSLDLSRTVDVVGVDKGKGLSIVFVHGGGGCRLMFASHARVLAEKGYRCVLLDLPGHGGNVSTELNLDSAIETVLKVTKEFASDFNGIKPVYVGGSLGGYVGMELLGRHPEVFSRALIAMSGQNVGKGRGFLAGLGIIALNFAVSHLSPVTLLKGMYDQAKANGHISEPLIQEMALRCGFFFQQGKQQVELLASTDPSKLLGQFKGKLLFINGSKDHRDSEKKWAECCENAELKVYQGADHFFTHDDRYMNTFIEDLIRLCQ